MADKFRDAQIFAIAPSGIPGLGQSSGFSFQLQDLGGAGHEELVSAREQLLGLAAGNDKLDSVRYANLADAPTFDIKIEAAKAGALTLPHRTEERRVGEEWGRKVRSRR